MTITYKGREYTITFSDDCSGMKNLAPDMIKRGWKPVLHHAIGARGATKMFYETLNGEYSEVRV